MHGYVKESLPQFNHKTPIKPQHQSYPAPERTYGADTQKIKLINMSSALPTDQVKIIDSIIVKFLYYARVVDNTCSVPLTTMETIIEPTEQDEKSVH